jgi:hypothetical protein
MKQIALGMKCTLLVAFLVISCSPRVMISQKADVDFKNYKTFAWLPNGASIKDDESVLHRSLVNTINQQMKELGYSLDRQNPDLLVLMRTMFDQETTVDADPLYKSYNYYFPDMYVHSIYDRYYYYHYRTVARVIGYDVYEVLNTKGTLVIDLIDKNTNRIVWRGAAKGYTTPNNRREEMKNFVRKIYAQFTS